MNYEIIMSTKNFVDIIAQQGANTKLIANKPSVKTNACCIVNFARKRFRILAFPLLHFLVTKLFALNKKAGNRHAG